MPSPIAHAAVGAMISKVWPAEHPPSRRLGGIVPPLLVACVVLSLLPDFDAAVGIVLGDLGRYHNNLAGSPAFGLLVAIAAGGLVRLVDPTAAKRAFLLTVVCYQGHVLMDYFTVGRGVMLLWPFTAQRFAPPIYLFYGLRWSDGLVSPHHLVTLLSELAFLGLLWGGVRWHSRHR
jgi:hypothetical protein